MMHNKLYSIVIVVVVVVDALGSLLHYVHVVSHSSNYILYKK
jgi:hypothetical protein